MRRYLAIRTVQLVAVVFVISIATFLLVHLLPGDPAAAILGPNDTPTAKHQLLTQLGLDKSLPQQYWIWLDHALHGNLGKSYLDQVATTSTIANAFPVDLELIIFSQAIAFVFAIPLALIAARRPNAPFDRIATIGTFGLLSLPAFVGAVLFQLLFAVKFHLFPATGYVPISQSLATNIHDMAMPSVVLGIGSIAIYYRLLRGDLIGTLQEDFITLAKAKGLKTRYIMTRHAFRPSSFSMLASAGINVGTLITGAFVVEYLYTLPGMGYTIVNAINSRDFLVVQGMALVIAVFYVVINFLVNFLLAVVDPRVRLV